MSDEITRDEFADLFDALDAVDTERMAAWLYRHAATRRGMLQILVTLGLVAAAAVKQLTGGRAAGYWALNADPSMTPGELCAARIVSTALNDDAESVGALAAAAVQHDDDEYPVEAIAFLLRILSDIEAEVETGDRS